MQVGFRITSYNVCYTKLLRYIEAVKDSEIQPECAFEEATEDNLDFDLRKAVLFTEILKPKYIDT